MILSSNIREECLRRVHRRCAGFARDEDGSLVIFGIYIFVIMLMLMGMAVDIMHFETRRAKMQATLDSAVLAAADLDQTLDATTLVEDYFAKAGLGNELSAVRVTQGFNSKEVEADADLSVNTFFMHLLGVNRLAAPVEGTAEEAISRVELSLVLDVSNSMNWNNRLPRLKVAARDFVRNLIDPAEVNDPNTPNLISISIVPFNHQVSAGPGLLQYYNHTGEHNYSHCVDFTVADYSSPALSTTALIQQAGYFDPWYSSSYMRLESCPAASSRDILPYSNNLTQLEAYIQNLTASGNTSIDIGTKWGAALLDPSARPVVTGMIAAGNADADFAGRPVDYNSNQTLKVLIVMSDGENTEHWELNPDFRDGDSNIYKNNNGYYTVYDPDRPAAVTTTCETRGEWRYNRWRGRWYWYEWEECTTTGGQYFWHRTDSWNTEPDGGFSNNTRLTYPQLWQDVSVRYMADDIMYPVEWNRTVRDFWRYNVYTQVSRNTKNPRTATLCDAIKAQGVVVFTIGFEATPVGDATLRDCATSPGHFFDVEGLQIQSAFAAIASQIQQLKLTQ